MSQKWQSTVVIAAHRWRMTPAFAAFAARRSIWALPPPPLIPARVAVPSAAVTVAAVTPWAGSALTAARAGMGNGMGPGVGAGFRPAAQRKLPVLWIAIGGGVLALILIIVAAVLIIPNFTGYGPCCAGR